MKRRKRRKKNLGKGALNLKHGPRLEFLDYVIIWSKLTINSIFEKVDPRVPGGSVG